MQVSVILFLNQVKCFDLGSSSHDFLKDLKESFENMLDYCSTLLSLP